MAAATALNGGKAPEAWDAGVIVQKAGNMVASMPATVPVKAHQIMFRKVLCTLDTRGLDLHYGVWSAVTAMYGNDATTRGGVCSISAIQVARSFDVKATLTRIGSSRR